jgi:cell division protein FtsX
MRAMKVLLLLMLLAVLGALAGAGVFMLKKRGPADAAQAQAGDKRMARALALRVCLSVAIFLLILLGWAMGWMKPTGVPMGM